MLLAGHPSRFMQIAHSSTVERERALMWMGKSVYISIRELAELTYGDLDRTNLNAQSCFLNPQLPTRIYLIHDAG